MPSEHLSEIPGGTTLQQGEWLFISAGMLEEILLKKREAIQRIVELEARLCYEVFQDVVHFGQVTLELLLLFR
jgi:hypothetical protein